ncbi:MAG TPA: methionine ABC transporter ATP-binding protein [Candidatus Avamphibacillus intestinigallinarum]|nr:methionine ABC transporter ATP-binding protein [Candidatus Avamphibacillus intestinigallinarum]
MISIEGLTKTFFIKEDAIHAVKDVNLTIAEGEIFGVIGYSGAGKSTFIRLLNRLEEPTSGKVFIGEEEITSLHGKELRKARQNIGMVFQHFNILWSRTVRENISYPLEVNRVPKAERNARVDELIQLVGLTDRADRYPSELSGGQKQRIGIARALANNPKVLLCDEATSALDPETTNSILDLLIEINQRLGLTIIMITHEMQVIRKICNRVAVMEDGQIVEEGDVLSVFSNPQETVTKRFVEQVMENADDESDVDALLSQFTSGKVMRLHFIGEKANEALISNVCRRYNVDISILQGKISQTQKGPYGTLLVHIDGEQEPLEQAITYMMESANGEVVQDA